MDKPHRPESEPKGEQALADVQNLLNTTPEIFGQELPSVQHSVRLANEELSKEGQLSSETTEVLSDYWQEFRPRTEAELHAEIESATKLLKKELEDLEYSPDSIKEIPRDFQRILEIIAATNKTILPHRVVQEYMRNFIMY